jgi:hypothetical protein
MGWVLRLAETGPDTAAESIDLIEIHRSSGLADISNLRLTLSEAKELLARVQQTMVAARARGSSAIVHVLLGPMSPQGLAAAADRDAVQRGGAEVAAMALCRLRTDRHWHRLAGKLPFDAGTERTSCAFVSPVDLQSRRRGAGPPSARGDRHKRC